MSITKTIAEGVFEAEASPRALAQLARMREVYKSRIIKMTGVEVDEYTDYTLKFWWGEVEADEAHTSVIFMLLD